jgi:hypothetical protein
MTDVMLESYLGTAQESTDADLELELPLAVERQGGARRLHRLAPDGPMREVRDSHRTTTGAFRLPTLPIIHEPCSTQYFPFTTGMRGCYDSHNY